MSSGSEGERPHAKRLRCDAEGTAANPPSGGDHTQSRSFSPELPRTSPLPESGPELFAARRALWLTPVPKPPRPRGPIEDHADHICSQDPRSESVWKSHLERVYNLLMTGRPLRRSMSMRFIVRVVYAGWIHEGLWPKGLTVDDSDSFLGDDAPLYTPPDLPPEPEGPP